MSRARIVRRSTLLLVVVVVALPRAAAANEIHCLLAARDEDELDDCMRTYDRPTVRLAARTASGTGSAPPGDTGVHVTSSWIETGVRPWSRDPWHPLRHVWLSLSLPVSAATYRGAAQTRRGLVLGNARAEASYEQRSVRAFLAVAAPTAPGEPGTRSGRVQAAAAAAWGYEQDPSFAAGRLGLLAGVDVDHAFHDADTWTRELPVHVGASFEAQALFATSSGVSSGVEVLPGAHVSYVLHRVPPYAPDELRAVTASLRVWSNVRVEPISAPVRVEVVGEARVAASFDRVRTFLAALVPFTTTGASVFAIRTGFETAF